MPAGDHAVLVGKMAPGGAARVVHRQRRQVRVAEALPLPTPHPPATRATGVRADTAEADDNTIAPLSRMIIDLNPCDMLNAPLIDRGPCLIVPKHAVPTYVGFTRPPSRAEYSDVRADHRRHSTFRWASATLAMLVALCFPAISHAGCGGTVTSHPGTHPTGQLPPLAIGDSTMLLSLPGLAAEGYQTNAHGCRSSSKPSRC